MMRSKWFMVFVALLCIPLAAVQADTNKLPPRDVISSENAEQLEVLMTLKHGDDATGVAFSPDGTKLVSGGGFTTLWDVETGKIIQTFKSTSNDNIPSEVGFSPDGQLVTATGLWSEEDSEGSLGILSIWNSVSGELVGSIEGYGGQESVEIANAVFSPDSQQFVIAFPPTIWNTTQVLKAGYIKQGARPHPLIINGEYGIKAGFSPDGKTFVIVTNEGNIRFWDTATSVEQKSFVLDKNRLSSVTFSPNGKLVATAYVYLKTVKEDDISLVKLRDVKSGEIVREFRGPQETNFVLVFSPDGKLLISGSWEGNTRIWDVTTGRQIVLLVNDRLISDVAFSPDGKLIATASRDGTVRLWGVPTN